MHVPGLWFDATCLVGGGGGGGGAFVFFVVVVRSVVVGFAVAVGVAVDVAVHFRLVLLGVCVGGGKGATKCRYK